MNIHYKEEESIDKIATNLIRLLKIKKFNNLMIFCIGTPRYCGDAVGPAVGSLLKAMELPIKIMGTMEDPIHALNIKKKLKKIRHEPFILSIDACLSQSSKQIGDFIFQLGPIYPGSALGKKLPPVGDISIKVITSKDLEGIGTVSAQDIFLISKQLAKGIEKAILLLKEKK